MAIIKDLSDKTNTFFERHSNPIFFAAPSWSEPYQFKGAWPNHDKQGCYAFFENGEVVYIGVAASAVGGIYTNCGIANRSSHYMQPVDGLKYTYKFRNDRWRDIEELRTIGFPPEYSYLSYALEVFLIRELKPTFNIINKK
jgi:excinuclease UvrABC nuclease subunit